MQRNHYPQVRPATDIVDREDGIHITANMPGVTEKDLHVYLNGNMLHIEASSRCPVPMEKKDVRTLEFGNVDFSLDIVMEGALSASLETTLEKGVLSIVVPRREGQTELPVFLR